jgi:hypothetical protein
MVHPYTLHHHTIPAATTHPTQEGDHYMHIAVTITALLFGLGVAALLHLDPFNGLTQLTQQRVELHTLHPNGEEHVDLYLGQEDCLEAGNATGLLFRCQVVR